MPWMIGNVVRNMFSRPVTRLYPLVRPEPFAGARGNIVFDCTQCEFCGDCVAVCPVKALWMETSAAEDGIGQWAVWDDDDEGIDLVWVRVHDPYRCIYCNLCVEACSYGALVAETQYVLPAGDKTEQKGGV